VSQHHGCPLRSVSRSQAPGTALRPPAVPGAGQSGQSDGAESAEPGEADARSRSSRPLCQYTPESGRPREGYEGDQVGIGVQSRVERPVSLRRPGGGCTGRDAGSGVPGNAGE
ncbi:hypothetical protein FKM82_026395, partial [Ascaphus truei]